MDSQSHITAHTEQYASPDIYSVLYEYTVLSRPAHENAEAI
jgi:hypothetical protein